MMKARVTHTSHLNRDAPARYRSGWRSRYPQKILSWNQEVRYAVTNRTTNRAWGFSKKSKLRNRIASPGVALELYAPPYNRISPAGVRMTWARPELISKSWKSKVPTR